MVNEEKTIEISDDIIAICAINATMRTEGVVKMSGGLSNALKKNILGKELISKGVKVSRDENSLLIDVHIIVEFGYNIPAVAWEIQENVKKEVNTFTELKVSEVNIHVEGVEVATEGEEDD